MKGGVLSKLLVLVKWNRRRKQIRAGNRKLNKSVSRKIKGQDSKLIEGVSWVDMVCKGLKDGIGPIDVVNDDKKDKLIGFTDDEEKGLCGELNAMSFRASEDMHCMGLYTLDDLRGSTEPVKSIKKKSAWEAGVDGKHCSQGAGLEDP
ncbi:hypothetical protein V6N11_020346 [Hibiscus sabdariffa]|uniref:Uncharacterized protein n=1 Tax=Hibiscus sabdariffa TaxID=183260 RepID=A0ABR2Q873_9ROSI